MPISPPGSPRIRGDFDMTTRSALERRSEVRSDVRADREERHIAQVEKARKADDDVRPSAMIT
jgi:hypothetical protein